MWKNIQNVFYLWIIYSITYNLPQVLHTLSMYYLIVLVFLHTKKKKRLKLKITASCLLLTFIYLPFYQIVVTITMMKQWWWYCIISCKYMLLFIYLSLTLCHYLSPVLCSLEQWRNLYCMWAKRQYILAPCLLFVCLFHLKLSIKFLRKRFLMYVLAIVFLTQYNADTNVHHPFLK